MMLRIISAIGVLVTLTNTAAAIPIEQRKAPTIQMVGVTVPAVCQDKIQKILDHGGYITTADAIDHTSDGDTHIAGRLFQWGSTVTDPWDYQTMAVSVIPLPYPDIQLQPTPDSRYAIWGMVDAMGLDGKRYCFEYSRPLNQSEGDLAFISATQRFVNARGEHFGDDSKSGVSTTVVSQDTSKAVNHEQAIPPNLSSTLEWAWKTAAAGIINPNLFLGLLAAGIGLLAFLLWRFWPRSLEWRIKRTNDPALRRRLSEEMAFRLEDEIRLTRSPAANLLRGMSRLIGLALFVGGVAAAYGIYLMFTDPRDEEFVRIGISATGGIVGAILTWALWNFLLRLVLIAPNFGARLMYFVIIAPFAVALTVGLSTALGLAGLGGPHAQQLDMLSYVDLLQSSLTQDALRAGSVETQVLPVLQQMETTFKTNAQAEVDKGAVCSVGEGPLFHFYTNRDLEANLLIGQVNAVGQRGLPDIDALRKQIAEPNATFRSQRYILAGKLEAARRNIALVFELPSYIPAMAALRDQLNAVASDAFFAGWAPCQLTRKPLVQQQIRAIVTNLDSLIKAVEVGKKATGTAAIIPEFRLRNELVAVIDHWKEVPYQIAFQVGLDAFPFLIAFFAVFLLPRPVRRSEEVRRENTVAA